MSGNQSTRQRADYTHKYNIRTGRHGWLRLTPAYSVKIVEERMSRNHRRPIRVLDPFCGTATTALSAAYHGHNGVTTDVNPFLVWLGRAKTAYYSPSKLASVRDAHCGVVNSIERGLVEPVRAPKIHNISRWWSSGALMFLRVLRSAIESETEEDSHERWLLLIAFCRTLISLLNAAFNHQSMSFKESKSVQDLFQLGMLDTFNVELEFVLQGAEHNPKGSGLVVQGDSRNLAESVSGSFDLVLTSPPYANRMSYIRELRPYMYWLGFLDDGRDAGELDWTAIGGTWGVATSRLTSWQPKVGSFKHDVLDRTLDRISSHSNQNGELLANYVAKYVDDMWEHFRSLISVLDERSEIRYIVGNSTFYGVLVSIEQLYVIMLRRLGFSDITCRTVRKRNSNKALYEFEVSAKWKRAGA